MSWERALFDGLFFFLFFSSYPVLMWLTCYSRRFFFLFRCLLLLHFGMIIRNNSSHLNCSDSFEYSQLFGAFFFFFAKVVECRATRRLGSTYHLIVTRKTQSSRLGRPRKIVRAVLSKSCQDAERDREIKRHRQREWRAVEKLVNERVCTLHILQLGPERTREPNSNSLTHHQ